MEEVLEYKTITKKTTGVFKDKGSKFIAYTFPVSNLDEVAQCMTIVKVKEHAARHYCYAYRIGQDGAKYRANDDGEPSHSAGDPILGQIDSHELTQIFIVVVRYFGGTKLGVGGLINAYRTAAKESLSVNNIVTKKVKQLFDLKFTYENMNIVMRYIKSEKAVIVSQQMEMECAMTVELNKEDASKFHQLILNSRKVLIKKSEEDWQV